MIEEKFQDIQIKYIFVKAFQWLHPMLRETYQGHLIEGAVYRDIYNPKTGNHKVPINGSDGIGFETLRGISDISEFDLVEITLDNILDYNISEEDLDKMNKWMSTNNTDLQQMFYTPDPIRNLTIALDNQEDEAEALAIGSEALMDLWNVNSVKFDIVLNLINYLTEADLEGYKDIANHIRYHKVNGKGVNMAQALRALDSYNSEDRRTNEDLSDLYGALEACITEIERKLINEQVD